MWNNRVGGRMQDQARAANRATLDAMTAFLKARLVKTTGFGADGPFRALSETAVRFNDTDWFWTDDNAKAAELLCEPLTYDRDPAVADAAVDFVLRMSRGAVIQRRGGPAELRVVSADPAAFRVETAFFILEGDLTRGLVRHALRFNDDRTIAAAAYRAGTLAFRLDDRKVTLEIGKAITAHAVEVEAHAVTLSSTSTLRHRARELGRVTFTYRVDRDRPSVGMTATLHPAAGAVLRDVVLATAIDGLGRIPRVHYRRLAVRAGDRDAVRPAPDGRAMLHEGRADFAAVVQEGGAPGFNYAIHSLLPDGRRLKDIVGTGRRGRLHTIVHRYDLGVASAAEAAPRLREERMLTGGGHYDALAHYAGVMAEGRGGGEADPSMSYDIGAELNAVAVHLLFAGRGRYAVPLPGGRVQALRSWYDRHIRLYFAHVRPGQPGDLTRVFTRGLAFVILSLDCMVRATGDPGYRGMLATAVGLVLRLARRRRIGRSRFALTFGDVWAPRGCFLDCHAACLLALARAARHGDPDGTIGRAIREGIADIRLYAGIAKLSRTRREPYEGLAVMQRRTFDVHVDTGFWTFKVGLVLRALHAARRAAAAGVIAMSAEDGRRLAARIAVAERQIALCSRDRQGMIEVLTSPIAGETNSETQPWVALGLVPIVDEEIETQDPGLPPADAPHPSLTGP